MPDRPVCPYCDNTGWRIVCKAGGEGAERCDHKPKPEPEPDRKTRASGEERES